VGGMVILGSCIASFLGHVNVVVCVDIIDSGSIIAPCSDYATACMWRSKHHTWSRPIAFHRDSMATCIMLSPDGSQTITGNAGGIVRDGMPRLMCSINRLYVCTVQK
jgi:WD40 repeat protein